MNTIPNLTKFVNTIWPYAKVLNQTLIVPEASARRYFRLILQAGKSPTPQTAIICADSHIKEKNEQYPFLLMQKFLRDHKLPVPEIYGVDFENSLLAQEDLGDVSLYHISKSGENPLHHYHSALDIMNTLQKLNVPEEVPAHDLHFDKVKLMAELDFFFQHGILHFRNKRISAHAEKRLFREFDELCSLLGNYSPKILCHRDFHSRNIMVKNNTLFIIDFQDARMGLPQYDTVSLIYDPYTALEKETRENLAEYAWEMGIKGTSQSRKEYFQYYHLSAAQRLLKACGTYGYQAITHNRTDYANNFDTALNLFYEVSLEEKSLFALQGVLKEILP